MKRPILIVVLGYIVGIILGLYYKLSIALFYLIILLVLFIIKKKVNLKSKIIRYSKLIIDKKLLLAFIISSVIANTITIILNFHYEEIYKTELNDKVTANVVSGPIKKEYYTRYKIKIESHSKILNGVTMYLNLKEGSNLEYGDKIVFLGEYVAPEVRRNYKRFFI